MRWLVVAALLSILIIYVAHESGKRPVIYNLSVDFGNPPASFGDFPPTQQEQ